MVGTITVVVSSIGVAPVVVVESSLGNVHSSKGGGVNSLVSGVVH